MFLYPLKDNEEFIISVSSGMDINGDPLEGMPLTFKGKRITKSTIRTDKNGKQLTISSTIFHKGDLAVNEDDVFSGIMIEGKQREIFSLSKVKDPMGRVHHVMIEVI